MARKASSLLAGGGGREGAVLLDCTPGDAEVLVDGVPQGRCDDFGGGRALKVGAGAHALEVRKSGYRPYRSVVSPGGARVGLEVTLLEGGTP